MQTTNTSNVKEIGGAAKAEVVEIILHTTNKERSIRVTAAIVDGIIDFKPKEAGRFKQITQLSVNALNEKPEFKGITENNFQQVLGGKIQMLLGHNM